MAAAPLVMEDLRAIGYRLADDISQALLAADVSQIDERTQAVRRTMKELTQRIEQAFHGDAKPNTQAD